MFSSPFLYLHKLGDKDHDDDNWNDETKKEKPDLEKSLFPWCFIKMKFLHCQCFLENIACKKRQAESTERHKEVGNQEIHGVKEGLPKDVNIRHDTVR